MIDYTRKSIVTTREYDVRGNAPDTVDRNSKRAFTLRPIRVELRTRDTASYLSVDAVIVHGRIVRKRDGELGPWRMICYYASGWDTTPVDELPEWIAEILKAEGLLYGGEPS